MVEAQQQAVVLQQPVAVGATAAQPTPVTMTLTQGGSVGSVKVLTQGNAGFDFTDAGGGSCTAGQSYLPGQQCTVQVGFAPMAPGLRLGAVVLLDQHGAALATQFVNALATGPLGVFVPGTIYTLAGDSAWIYSGDGQPATQSAIFLPYGFALDAAGDIYIADSSNNRVRRVDATTRLISTVAGNGLVGSEGDGGPATQAELTGPTAIALDPAGNVYFSDSGNNVVRRIDAFTGVISTVVGTLGTSGYAGDGGPAAGAKLNTPNGLTFDANGNLYVADSGNNVVRMVAAGTGLISTVAGVGTPGFSGDGGLATAAKLDYPWSVTVAPNGGFYIADQNNNRVRMVDSTGIITTIMGTGVAGFAGDGGPAAAAQVTVPASVAVDAAGNLYVADSGNNRVRKVNAQTGVVQTIAGGQTQAYGGDGGPATAAGLYGPYTLAIDGAGDLLIADVFHNRIRMIASNQATLNYQPMRVGRVSPDQVQVLENDGNAPLTVTSLTAMTNAQVDAQPTSCNAGQLLIVLQQCAIAAEFAPTVTGLSVTGTIDMLSNASNSPGVLTLEGQVLDVDPATVTVISSLNPATVGQTITFSVTVSSAGTTPTGTVTLLDGTAVIAAGSLQNGAVNLMLSTLTGGQHSITASYSGDNNNSSAVSTVLMQTVQDIQAPTATTESASVNPVIAGAPLSLMATVSVLTPGTGQGSITGSVTFTEGSTVLGGAAVVKGVATLPISTLTVGTHSIVATYSSDVNYAASVSSALVVRVQIATSKVGLTTSLNPAVAGAPVTLTAQVISNGGVPTGTVVFSDGSTVLGTGTVDGKGNAVLTVPGATWTPGTHTLTASYAGDAADTASVSSAVAEVVNLATTQVALVSSVSPVGLGGQVMFTATVSGNGGKPTGTVNFFDGSAQIGSGTLNALGVATFATSTLALGSHAVSAVYAGDTWDAGATSAAVNEVVQQATVAITLGASANPVNFGQALTLTATVTGTGSAPLGTVVFTDQTAGGTVTLGTVTLSAAGVASFPAAGLAIGAHSIVAQYSGDVNHAGVVSSALSERVVQTTTTALQASANHAVAGTPLTFAATVTGANGLAVTGNVTFSDGGTTLGTVATGANGAAQMTTSSLAPGQHAIMATYAGDALDAGSASSAAAELVTIAQTAVALTTSGTPVFSGATVTLTATVTGNGGIPAGTVTFRDGSTVLSTVNVGATGVATLPVSTLAPGIHALTASYSGDTYDAPATSAALQEQVVEKTSVTLSSSANPSLLQDNVTVTVTVANGVAGAAPTGAVTLTDNGNTVANGIVDATGAVSFTMNGPAAGQHTLVASYAGDNQNQAATSSALVQTVNLRPTTTSYTPSSTSLSQGQQLIFTAIVQGSGSRPATGTVTFASGATVLGTAPISAAGIATFTATPAQGLYNVVAQYSGDTLFAGSAAAAISITVGPPVEFTLSTSGAMTLQSGQHAAMTVNIASAPTFNDTLALGCAGLPASATCTFSTTQVALSGGAGKTVTVTVDTGNPLGAGASAKVEAPMNRGHGVMVCFVPGGLLLALLLGRRRRGTRGAGLLAAMLMMMLAGGAMLTGCASSFSQSETPAGSYTFQIVGTGQQTGATGAATVQLTVTQ